jgi:LAO/AO transport system kinase
MDGAGALYQSILEFISDTKKKPHVVKVSAKNGKGIKEVAIIIDQIIKQKSSNRKENEKKKLEIELRDMVLNTIEQKVSSMLDKNNKYYDFIEKLVNKTTDPFEAAEEVIRTMSW